MTLLLVHGWGFDRTVWAPLRAALGDGPALEVDLGYFGAPARPAAASPTVVVGHSFGALWLLGNLPANCRAFVAVNGFDRFTGPEGTPARVLDRMLSRFDARPDQVVGDFRRRCGEGRPAPALDPGRLREDLLALRDQDRSLAARALSIPVLSLQGGEDPILPDALRAAAFGGPTAVCEGGGHLLPLTAPEWCAAHIRSLLEHV